MSYTLHAVIVKKPIELNKAKQKAKHFITDKPLKFRETTTSYRFMNYPKEEFQPKTFKTKKINNDVSLIFGTHKEGKDELVEGGGIVDNMIESIGNFLLKYNPLTLGVKHAIKQGQEKRLANQSKKF
jgi:hypothetical protein